MRTISSPYQFDCPQVTRAWRSVLIVVCALVLTACGKQPPGCADPELAKIAASFFQDALLSQASGIAANDKGITANYAKGIKAEFQNAVDDGHNKETRKRMCKGILVATSSNGTTVSAETAYSAQVTADGKDTLLWIQRFSKEISATGFYKDVANIAIAERFKGAWNGTLQCSGVGGETTGARGPLTQPVSIVFGASDQMMMERTTLAGGVEKMTGSARIFSGDAVLQGEGMNSPEDRWLAEYKGTFKGDTMSLKGGSITPDRQNRLRSCTIEVTHNGPVVASASQSNAPALQAATPPQIQAAPAQVQAPAAEAVSKAPSAVLPATPVATAPTSARPSFDCAKASTPVETAICGAPELARLDAALAENYRNINNSNIGDGARADLKLTQRQWAAERNKCSTNQCINAAYRIRLDKVCEYPVLSGAHPPCTSANEIK